MNKINKITILAVVLLAITNMVVLYCYYNWGRIRDPDSIESKIDSLKTINDSLVIINIDLSRSIDSLKKESLTIDSVIVEINHWYEKGFDSITSQPIADDVHFFTNYLSKIDSGLINSNNSYSIKKD